MPENLAENFEKKSDSNQYWYSISSIITIVQEILEQGKKVAFLSTPSIYYSLPKDHPVKLNSKLFDIDESLADSGFVYFDFHKANEIPSNLFEQFDMVVVDPPFITRDVWSLYATIIKKLLITENGKILCTTTMENQDMMYELLKVRPTKWKPCIPNLVYQYDLYINYPSIILQENNPEIYSPEA